MQTYENAAESVVMEDRKPQPVQSIRATVRVTELTQTPGESLGALQRFTSEHRITPSGPPFVRYHTFGETETDVEVGVPVGEAASGEGVILRGVLPGGATLSTWHIGSHDGLGEAYGRLRAWLTLVQRQPNGGAWEVYTWIDLTREPNPAEWPAPSTWRTELVQPIA